MIKRIVIVVVGVIVVILGRGFFYYQGFYSPPPTQITNFADIVISPAPTSEFSENISDNISEEEKAVLIDLAHNNNFALEELNVLLTRFVARGLHIKVLGAEDDLEEELLGEKEEEPEEETPGEEAETNGQVESSEPTEEGGNGQQEEILNGGKDGEQVGAGGDGEAEEEEELPPVAFVIVSPQDEFSKEERGTVEKFVENGGKVLLIDDPTRESEINSISIVFGLIFEPDYLYNLSEYEINYRHIFVSEFEEDEITKGVSKLVLYVSGSISSAEGGIAFVDENTVSSVIESKKKLSPIALDRGSQVLGVHDLTFMTEPYNGAFDNNRLIANIAEWISIPAKEGDKTD